MEHPVDRVVPIRIIAAIASWPNIGRFSRCKFVVATGEFWNLDMIPMPMKALLLVIEPPDPSLFIEHGKVKMKLNPEKFT